MRNRAQRSSVYVFGLVVFFERYTTYEYFGAFLLDKKMGVTRR